MTSDNINRACIIFCLYFLICLASPVFAERPSLERGATLQGIAQKSESPPSTYREYYFPGTETLAPDEMRVIALGTGSARIQSHQASSCWLMELGNGDKFLFDMGRGCTANLSKLGPYWGKYNKIFLTHLHFDHIGDVGAIYVGGALAGRTTPLRIWGPSGSTPELGTKAAMDHIEKTYLWDKLSRQGRISVTGMKMDVTQFDFFKTQVVYNENGVVIKSWPAVHTIDGPVSYSLEWKGLKVVYSGDTAPNKWFMANSRNADLIILNCMPSEENMLKFNIPQASRKVISKNHATSYVAGIMFRILKPRMAVCTHSLTDIRTLPIQIGNVRKTYHGPFIFAEDMLVFNIKKGRPIKVRKAVGGDMYLNRIPLPPPNKKLLIKPSRWVISGRLSIPELEKMLNK